MGFVACGPARLQLALGWSTATIFDWARAVLTASPTAALKLEHGEPFLGQKDATHSPTAKLALEPVLGRERALHPFRVRHKRKSTGVPTVAGVDASARAASLTEHLYIVYSQNGRARGISGRR